MNLAPLFQSRTEARTIYHACHHKCGTHWFKRILSTIANEYGLSFASVSNQQRFPSADIILDPQSLADIDAMPPLCGSHMIRDPRDVVVSGYFYHLWTSEEWVLQPREEYGGRSYQQQLHSLDQQEGLMEEIKKSRYVFRNMQNWDYDH